jgi:hypothetical protein
VSTRRIRRAVPRHRGGPVPATSVRPASIPVASVPVASTSRCSVRTVLAGIALAVTALAAGAVGAIDVAAAPEMIPGPETEPVVADSSVAFDDSTAFEFLRGLAREDTLGLPPRIDYIYRRYIETRENLPTLEEIIRWCIENEKAKYAKVSDISLLQRMRTAIFWKSPADTSGRRVLIEDVDRVYFEQPDRYLTLRTGERTWDSKKDEGEQSLQVEVRTSGDVLSDLPVFFTQVGDYAFQILERKILQDRIVYKIRFEPRSEFAALPEGWFLVDTTDYQILRAEYAWTKNVPYPLFLKAVDHVVVQRSKHGDVWLPDRINIVATLRDLPLLSSPRRVEIEGPFEDVRIDQGIPDSVWTR